MPLDRAHAAVEAGAIDPEEGLNPGRAAEIDRVSAAYPHLTDDDYVRANRARWLA